MFSEAETQVLIAVSAFDMPDQPPTLDNLIQFGRGYFQRSLVDWTDALDCLLDQGLIAADDDRVTVTAAGETAAASLRTAYPRVHYFYRDFYAATQHSRTHATFCERVYGKNLCQHGYMDMAQLNALLDVTGIGPHTRVLDLGCGNGMIAEYIADETGAQVYGIDRDAEAIRQALHRTAAKRVNVAFTAGDIYQLDLPPATFDTVIAIDSLYFGEPDAVLEKLKTIVTPGGQMAVYYMQIAWDEDGDRSILHPDQTPLGQALARHALAYRTWDYTQAEYERSQRSRQTAEELKAGFEAENNLFLYENRIQEAEGNLRFIESGRARRTLYHVTF